EDAARGGAQSGTDTEIGKRSMGVFARLFGDGDEMFVVLVVARSHRSPVPKQLRFPRERRAFVVEPHTIPAVHLKRKPTYAMTRLDWSHCEDASLASKGVGRTRRNGMGRSSRA